MVATAIAVTVAALLACTCPLGVDGEWVWQRYNRIDFPLVECLLLVLGFTFAAAIAFRTDHMPNGHGWRIAGVIAVLALGSWADFQLLLAGKTGLAENVYAVLDRHTTGFLSEAARIRDAGQYAATFHERLRLPKGDVHHLDVHPPGHILLAFTVLQFCREHPGISTWLVERLPYDVADGLKQAQRLRYFEGLLDDAAVYPAACVLMLLQLAGLFIARCCVLLAAGLLLQSWRRSALVACLAAAVPSPILFLGHFDTLCFCGTAVCLLLFAASRATRGPPRLAWSAATGLACGIGVVFTLGYGALIALFVVFWLARAAEDRRSWLDLFAFGAGGLLVVALCTACGLRIIAVCFQCLENNSEFHMDTNRGWRWLLVNPPEFLVFFGAACSSIWLLSLRHCAPRKLFEGSDIDVLRIGAVTFLAYLLVHPYCRGEAARLTLLYMPVILLVCAVEVMADARSRRDWLLVLAAAALGLLQTFFMRLTLRLAFFHGEM